MDTSRRIKQRQYDPIQPVRVLDRDRAIFASESRERVKYTTARKGREFKCGCPARGLCEHIVWMVKEHGHERFRHVSVWTSEADARRQRRKWAQFIANRRPFWVTFAGRIEEPDPVEELDAEIRDLGTKLAEARHRRLMTSGGQVRADARAEMEQLRERLMDRQVAREWAVVDKAAA